MYLVMWRTTLDDVPVRLFPSKREAERFADNLKPSDIVKAHDAMQIDMCSAVNVSIVRFRPSGTVRGMMIARDDVDLDTLCEATP